MASSLADLSRNGIPVRAVNVDDKARIIKEGEVLTTCAPVTYINRNLLVTITESSDALINEILQNAKLNLDQRSAVERLLIQFQDLISKTSSDVGRTKVTRHQIDTGNHSPIKQHPRRLPFTKQEKV